MDEAMASSMDEPMVLYINNDMVPSMASVHGAVHGQRHDCVHGRFHEHPP